MDVDVTANSASSAWLIEAKATSVPEAVDQLSAYFDLLLRECGDRVAGTDGVRRASWRLNGAFDIDQDDDSGDAPRSWSIDTTMTLNYDSFLGAVLARAADLHESGFAHSDLSLANIVVDAADDLDATNVSRLITLVKSWSDAADAALADAEEDAEPTTRVAHSFAIITNAVSYIVDGNHRQRAWLASWGREVLPTLLVGVSADKLLDLLYDARRAKRAGAVRQPRATKTRLKGQLARLAHAIVPHAPPTSACPCPS